MAEDLTPLEKYNSEGSFTTFLTRIGLNPNQVHRLNMDGFTTMKHVVEHYKNSGPKQMESYLKDLNKTFATASTAALRVYYNPMVVNRLVGSLNYFQHLIYTFHSIMDLDEIDIQKAELFSGFWVEQSKTQSETNDDDEIEIPQLKGYVNWTSFRDAFLFKLRTTMSTRKFSMEYLLDDEPREVERSNAAYVEIDEVLDLSDINTYKEKAIHFGEAYKLDNNKLWHMIEAQVINTDPYNHIALFAKSKNGRAAFDALKLHYEGENAKQRMRTIAMDKLKSTKYYGDTKFFSFEKYVNIHVKAHKQLLDIKFNQGQGLDDDTKIFYFKEGIEPRADLETALTLARPKENGSFQDYVIFLSTEVDSKNRRKRQTSKNERRVSQVNRKSNRKNDQNQSNVTDLGPMLYEVVDGKRLESKQYSRRDFLSLSQKQRSAVVRLNRRRRRNASRSNEDSKKESNVSAITAKDREQLTDDMISVGNAIVAAIAKGKSEPSDEVVTVNTEEDSRSKRTATAGSVGDFFAAARKRSKSSL